MENKPAIIKFKETEQRLIEIINNSGLPAFILVSMVEKILVKLQELEQQDLQKETEEYNKSKEEKENG